MIIPESTETIVPRVNYAKFENFSELKGKMNWPVTSGKITLGNQKLSLNLNEEQVRLEGIVTTIRVETNSFPNSISTSVVIMYSP